MVKNHFKSIKSLKLAIIGLGYVGLPLAIEFGKRFVLGYDIRSKRILDLKNGKDETLETKKKILIVQNY